jgi:uncharacterized protein YdhG (YjbR/CyaY superfamily)
MNGMVPTVDIYLKSLPQERREIIAELRKVILENLPEGYQEGMEYGMIAYYIPLSKYPETYNGQPLGYISIASNKNYISLYLMGIYGEGEAEFKRAYKKTGKKLDMGKSCVRFTKLEDLPLELIAQTVAKYTPEQFIELYERSRG